MRLVEISTVVTQPSRMISMVGRPGLISTTSRNARHLERSVHRLLSVFINHVSGAFAVDILAGSQQHSRTR